MKSTCKQCGKMVEYEDLLMDWMNEEFGNLESDQDYICQECQDKISAEHHEAYKEEYAVLEIIKNQTPSQEIHTENDDFCSLAKKQNIPINRELSLQKLSLQFGIAYWFSKDGQNRMAYEECRQYAPDGFVNIIKIYAI